MNMMTMAKMEEALKESWTIYWADDMPHRLEAAAKWPATVLPVSRNFEKGFRAGAAFAQRQANIEGSSQAVGNIHASEEVPQHEDDKFIVWKTEDLRSVVVKSPWLRRYFNSLVDEINDHRKSQGKTENKYIVCNQDEPYADRVWNTILEGEMEKVGIYPEHVWKCGICGVRKLYDAEKPVYDAECGECCQGHYQDDEPSNVSRYPAAVKESEEEV